MKFNKYTVHLPYCWAESNDGFLHAFKLCLEFWKANAAMLLLVSLFWAILSTLIVYVLLLVAQSLGIVEQFTANHVVLFAVLLFFKMTYVEKTK